MPVECWLLVTVDEATLPKQNQRGGLVDKTLERSVERSGVRTPGRGKWQQLDVIYDTSWCEGKIPALPSLPLPKQRHLYKSLWNLVIIHSKVIYTRIKLPCKWCCGEQCSLIASTLLVCFQVKLILFRVCRFFRALQISGRKI